MCTHLVAFFLLFQIIFLSKRCQGYPRASVNIGAVVNMFTGDLVNQNSVLLRSMVRMAVYEINNKTDNLIDNLLPNTSVKISFADPRETYYYGITTSHYLATSAFNGTGVDLSVGSNTFPIAKVIGEVMSQFNIMQLSYNNDPQFTYSSIYTNMFRTVFSSDFQGRGLADLCFNYFGWSKVSVFLSNDYFGTCAFTEFQLQAADLGISILSIHQIIQHGMDFTIAIKNAAASYASIFVILADSIDTANLLQAGYNAGLFVEGTQVLGTSLAATDATWKSISDNANAIFKGFIALNPIIDLTNPKLLAFTKRFSKLAPTVTTSAGEKICSNITDDDGGYVFKGKPDYKSSSPYVCAGISDYSLYSNPSSLSSSLFYAYDAIYAGFHALHDYIYTVGINNVRSTRFQSFLRNNVSFEGITGNISFSPGLLGVTSFSAGSRRVGAYYQIVNYQLCTSNTTSPPTTTLCAKNIGAWHGELGYKDCTAAGFSNCAKVVYNTADNSKPLDWPSETYSQMSQSLRILLWLLVVIATVMIIASFLLVVIYRHSTTIKLSQPSMLYFILFGCLLGVGRIILSIQEPNVIICISRTWLCHLAYAIVFGTLFLKTWRVHRLVNSGLRRVVVTTGFINGTVFGVIGLLCIYLAIITAISTPYITYSTVYVKNHTTKHVKCTLRYPSYSTALLVMEALSLIIGLRLCWLTRGVPDEVNEAVYIASAILVIAFICLVNFPSVYLLDLDPVSIRLVSSVGFFLAIAWTLAAQFGPKAYSIWTNNDGIAYNNIQEGSPGSGKYAPSPSPKTSQKVDPPTMSNSQRVKVVMIPSSIHRFSDSVVPFSNIDGKVV